MCALAFSTLTEGGPFVHCSVYQTIDRGFVTGLMAACTMVALFGISAEEALYRVQASFDTRSELGEALDMHSRHVSAEDWQHACCGIGGQKHNKVGASCKLSPVTSDICMILCLDASKCAELWHLYDASLTLLRATGSKSPETRQQCDFVREFAHQWSSHTP